MPDSAKYRVVERVHIEKFMHPKYPGAATVSGQSGDDVKHYQEKQISQAIESVKNEDK